MLQHLAELLDCEVDPLVVRRTAQELDEHLGLGGNAPARLELHYSPAALTPLGKAAEKYTIRLGNNEGDVDKKFITKLADITHLRIQNEDET